MSPGRHTAGEKGQEKNWVSTWSVDMKDRRYAESHWWVAGLSAKRKREMPRWGGAHPREARQRKWLTCEETASFPVPCYFNLGLPQSLCQTMRRWTPPAGLNFIERNGTRQLLLPSIHCWGGAVSSLCCEGSPERMMWLKWVANAQNGDSSRPEQLVCQMVPCVRAQPRASRSVHAPEDSHGQHATLKYPHVFGGTHSLQNSPHGLAWHRESSTDKAIFICQQP